MLRRDQRPLKYALQIGEVPKYQTDIDGNIKYEILYTDDEGNEIPLLDENGDKVPLYTGETEVLYSEPVDFTANISMSGGEAEAVEYGLSTEDYQAVVVYRNGDVPLVEGALIWFKSDVEYHNETESVVDGKKITGKFPKSTSADYRVIKISESLNFTKAILKAVNK